MVGRETEESTEENERASERARGAFIWSWSSIMHFALPTAQRDNVRSRGGHIAAHRFGI